MAREAPDRYGRSSARTDDRIPARTNDDRGSRRRNGFRHQPTTPRAGRRHYEITRALGNSLGNSDSGMYVKVRPSGKPNLPPTG